ncbi:hypothetical protein FJZ21_01615 [Candidatus Pacearchaeota archaeon]|nr:hypothetical protein [Candidatus Pacearchaeota archaeon]
MVRVVRDAQESYALHLDEEDRRVLTDIYLPDEIGQTVFLRVKPQFHELTGRVVDSNGQDVGESFVIVASTNLKSRQYPARPNEQHENHGEYQERAGGIDVIRNKGEVRFHLSLGGVLDRIEHDLRTIEEVFEGQPTVRVYRRSAA